jgi:hypothetical protein
VSPGIRIKEMARDGFPVYSPPLEGGVRGGGSKIRGCLRVPLTEIRKHERDLEKQNPDS